MSDIKPIRNIADHRAALAEIERLFDAQPGTPEADRLEVLIVLATAWEAKTIPLDAADPIDALTFAMKAQGRSQSDFAGVLKSRSRASEILNRRRALTGDMIDAISKAWSIPAAALGGGAAIVGGGLRRWATTGAAALVVFAAAALPPRMALCGTPRNACPISPRSKLSPNRLISCPWPRSRRMW